MQEKAQDNISKLVEAEKESLALEKDNEEQSKYYSAIASRLFWMKWENQDINLVEWANIPKLPPLLNGD